MAKGAFRLNKISEKIFVKNKKIDAVNAFSAVEVEKSFLTIKR